MASKPKGIEHMTAFFIMPECIMQFWCNKISEVLTNLIKFENYTCGSTPVFGDIIPLSITHDPPPPPPPGNHLY